MLTTENLREFGADVGEGLARCMNNEGFYFRLIGMAAGDAGFEALANAVKTGDLDEGFKEAHKLKGAIGNLSLTPIYAPIYELTELLRHKTPGDYEGLVAEILAKRDELKKLIEA